MDVVRSRIEIINVEKTLFNVRRYGNIFVVGEHSRSRLRPLFEDR